MTQTRTAPDVDVPQKGLLARMVGIVFSPADAYAQVAARPRWLGVMAAVLAIMIACQVAFLMTEVGKTALLQQQVDSMRAFGMEVSAEMIQQMQARLAYAPYTTAGVMVVTVPIVNAILAGLLLAVFSAILDGRATFKHVYAVLAHAGVIGALQQMFNTPINYARADMSSPTSLRVFAPMLDDDTFLAYLLGGIDLFFIWMCVSIAIGLGVLYRRRPGSIAVSLLTVYVAIVATIAAVRAF